MLPLKLLLDKLMIWKVVILQIQCGISPVSLLFAIKRIHRLRRSWKWLLKQIGSLKERFIKEPRSTEGIYMGPFVYAAAAVF
jgi:hypothetical protein